MTQVYFVLESMLKGRESRKVANNTYVERLSDSMIGLRLHNTYVVKATLDWVELDSGGFHTSTTADRMRHVVMIGANGKRGWSVYRRGENGYADWDYDYPYWDRMRLDAYGNRPLPKADQPNWPEHWEPVVTVSGWSGMTRGESHAARNRQIAAIQSGDWDHAMQIRDQLAGKAMAPDSVTTESLGGRPMIAEHYTLQHDSIKACPHFIFSPEHYRPDGSCRCNDPEHLAMVDWGYDWNGRGWE